VPAWQNHRVVKRIIADGAFSVLNPLIAAQFFCSGVSAVLELIIEENSSSILQSAQPVDG
jgi:hypothetical protein